MNFPNNDLPLVSIVAINYNNSKYIIETLDSIAAQTYSNTELIIVDDCSTDDSVRKIEDWLVNYKKPFQFIYNQKNEGVCATCNKGYQAAKGKYISSIATDDVMLPEKIAKQSSFFETLPDDTGMIYSDAYLIDDDGNDLFGTFIQKLRNFDNVPTGSIFNDLLEGNFIPAMATMIKASVFKTIGYFDESLSYEDYDMWLRIARNYKIIFHNEITVKYRKRKNSLMTTIKSFEWLNSNVKIFAKFADDDISQKKMTEQILGLYLNNYPYKDLIKTYKIQKKGGFTYKCARLGIPANITKKIRTLLGKS